MKQKFSLIILTIIGLYLISFASALIVDSDFVTLYPGQSGKVKVDVENTNNFDVEDVSVSLILSNVPFTVEGSSTEVIDNINNDDSESVSFNLRASSDIKPGDYNIPYEIVYNDEDGNQSKQNGSFGIRVSAKTDLDFVAETENNIIGQQGKINLEIVNRGLGQIKSVSVELNPQGFEAISTKKIFVGTIDPEDSDFVTYDVIFKSANPTASAIITYKDFDNKDQTQTVNLPIKAYTEDEAIQLGLIKKSNTGLYIGIVVLIIILWILWKIFRRKRKTKE